MITVALTGGIATGKTHVLDWFARHGVPTIDSDRLAREAVTSGEPAWRAIRERFGPAILGPGGEIDRQALAEIVFQDDSARRDLEAIVHPAVYAAIRRWLDDLAADQRTAFAIADIPLLFETGRADEFDRVIVTTCSPETQVARIRLRDGTSEEAARRRIAAQWPGDRRVEQADFVIETEGRPEDTDRQAAEVHARLIADAAG